jgi:phage terminase small subunit
MAEKKTKKPKEAKKKPSPKLSIKHLAFVNEYLKLNNATKAYMNVYPSSGYDAARSSSADLLAKANIKAYVNEHYKKQWEDKETEIGRTFNNLVKIANSDINDVVEVEDGKMKIKNLDEIDSYIIQEIKQTVTNTKDGENKNTSIKVYDKVKAIDGMLKVLGMIKEKADININLNYDKESAKEIQEIFNEQISSKKNN